MMKTRSLSLFGLAVVLFTGCMGCSQNDYTPKPRGYFRIELPEKGYQPWQSDDCPFKFEYPDYARVERDTTFFDERPDDPCWMNVVFPGLDGTIYMSYKAIDEENTLSTLVDDAHKLTSKHIIKADYIDESVINNQHGVQGILYEVGGDAASNIQFYVTDSTSHFVRGSLYFRTNPNADSLAPVVKFVKADMLHLLDTFRWQ